MTVDGRIFEAQDEWETYAKAHGWKNPWDIEDEIMEKYRHEKEISKSSWEIVIEDPSSEDAWRLKANRYYKEKYIKRRDLFLFYQYKKWMGWEQLRHYVPQWCQIFYPCDDASKQCSIECEWWPCQNEGRKAPEMEELMEIIERWG